MQLASHIERTSVALVALLLVFICSTALAAVGGDDDEDMFQTAHRASAGKTRGRAYLGARDEQGLEVQVSLAQPSRNPDGTAAVPDEDDEPRTDAPASD